MFESINRIHKRIRSSMTALFLVQGLQRIMQFGIAGIESKGKSKSLESPITPGMLAQWTRWGLRSDIATASAAVHH